MIHGGRPFHPGLGCAAIGATATGEVSSLGGAEAEVEASAGAGRGDVSHAAGVQQMPSRSAMWFFIALLHGGRSGRHARATAVLPFP